MIVATLQRLLTLFNLCLIGNIQSNSKKWKYKDNSLKDHELPVRIQIPNTVLLFNVPKT